MEPVNVNGTATRNQRTHTSEKSNDGPGWADWTGFLEELGIHGFQTMERPILCSLITGDPVLLIGAHGTAKTALAEVLADALGLNFHAYDASKAMFEDMVGFPNPEALGQGELDYVPTKISLWDKEFILADEISRASAQTQSKWLEIIRSRNIMGQSLDRLQYIFAAMNPPGTYDGANPLDPALAGRFAWILKVPESADMNHEQRVRVSESIGGDDAPVASDVFNTTIQSGEPLDALRSLDRYRERLKTLRTKWSEKIARYISRLSESVFTSSQKETGNLDGRRIGIIRRNILAALSLQQDPAPDDEVFLSVLLQSLPHRARGEEIPTHLYEMAHREAYRAVFGGETSISANSSDDLLDKALDEESFEEVVTPLALLGREVYRVTEGETPDDSTVDTIRRVLHTGQHALDENWDTLRSMDDYVSRLWSDAAPTADLSQILVCWWCAEKDKRIRSCQDEFAQTVKEVQEKLDNLFEGESR